MSTGVTIHYGATRATLTFPGGEINLNDLHGSDRSKVRRTVVDAYCKANGIETKKPKTRKRRRRK